MRTTISSAVSREFVRARTLLLTRTTRGIRPIVIAAVIVTAVTPVTRANQTRAVDQEDAAPRLIALDPRWTVSFDTAPAAPAGYDQQMAYVPLKGGELVAVDLNGGEVKWKVELATSFTPSTGDGLVFAGADGELRAFEQKTGAIVWRAPLDAPLAGPLSWDSGWLFAPTEGGDLVALNGQDGGVVWRIKLESPLAVPPSTSGDRVYVALRDGRIVALDQQAGAIHWTYPLKETVTGLLALDDQVLVGTRNNLLHSLSLTRGRIRWSQRAGADIAGAPLADEDRIYFAAFDNVIRALDRDNGNLKWTRNLPSRPAGGPLRADNVVLLPFVTTDIGAFDAETGKEAFTIRAVGELGGVPFFRESPRATLPRLIAMSREGALQGFAARFEPAVAPLTKLPGVEVKGGW